MARAPSIQQVQTHLPPHGNGLVRRKLSKKFMKAASGFG
jgi:hypothetical protein